MDNIPFWNTKVMSALAISHISSLKASYDDLKYTVFPKPKHILNEIYAVLEQLHKIMFTKFDLSDLRNLKIKRDSRIDIFENILGQLQSVFGVLENVINDLSTPMKVNIVKNRVQGYLLHGDDDDGYGKMDKGKK
ncbi:hypothetical protein H4219_003454 [Mycoemilia scoparia]|uniref:Uncharacterized protein n=1 Tax=Mycoemilia scoparia TaxID=417184 RepID=A0A9W8DMT0_9FUNG|nr:hypothetical protein H4219_003454 [Mycoemilia scoparia]